MGVEGVSPGGPRVSSAKKRRLAALEQNLGAAAPSNILASQPKSSPPRSGSGTWGQTSSAGGGSEGGGKRAGAGGGGVRAASSGSLGGQLQQRQKKQQQQPSEPPYDRLDPEIACGAAAEAMQLPPPQADSQVISSLLEQLMATNPRAFDARAAIGLKVQDRTVMLDNPVGQQQAARQRQQGWQHQAVAGRQGGGRWTAALASKKQQRQQPGLFELQGAALTYASVQPLYRSWQQYMGELLAPGVSDVEARLYAADLHGCLMRVAHTADRRYQGLQGIVVRDTANTLQLVTPDNRLRVVPKQLCTWEFDADWRRVVTLLGPGLVRRDSSGLGGNGGGGNGGGGSSGGAGRPKTLREAIRGQNRR